MSQHICRMLLRTIEVHLIGWLPQSALYALHNCVTHSPMALPRSACTDIKARPGSVSCLRASELCRKRTHSTLACTATAVHIAQPMDAWQARCSGSIDRCYTVHRYAADTAMDALGGAAAEQALSAYSCTTASTRSSTSYLWLQITSTSS